MPDFRRATCRVDRGGCGKNAREAGPISWTGLCGECGPKIHVAQLDDLHYHRGPEFEKWRRSMVACVGGVLLDERGQSA